MSSHSFITLAQTGGYSSVMTCISCNDGVLHVNFYDTSIRMHKDIFLDFVSMLNKAVKKIQTKDGYAHVKDNSDVFMKSIQNIIDKYRYN